MDIKKVKDLVGVFITLIVAVTNNEHKGDLFHTTLCGQDTEAPWEVHIAYK